MKICDFFEFFQFYGLGLCLKLNYPYTSVSSGNKSVPTFVFRSFLILGGFRLWGTRIRWNYQVLTSGGTSTGGGRWVKTSKIQVFSLQAKSHKRSVLCNPSLTITLRSRTKNNGGFVFSAQKNPRNVENFVKKTEFYSEISTF